LKTYYGSVPLYTYNRHLGAGKLKEIRSRKRTRSNIRFMGLPLVQPMLPGNRDVLNLENPHSTTKKRDFTPRAGLKSIYRSAQRY